MRRIPTNRWFALALAVTCSEPAWRASTVLAQESDVESLVQRAEDHLRNRRYEKAISEYLKAYEMSDKSAYLHNVALIYLLRLGDPLHAWEFARRALEHPGSEQHREDTLQVIERAESELRRTHGCLTFEVQPEGASVWLDEMGPETRLSRAVVWVVPGRHRVIAEASGYEEWAEWVEVRVGTTTKVPIALKPRLVSLRVTCEVPDCRVSVGDSPSTPSPAEFSLLPGVHRVRAEAPGFVPGVEEVEATPGETRSVRIDLVRAAPPEPTSEADTAPRTVRTTSGMSRRTWTWVAFGGAGACLIAGGALVALGFRDARVASDMDQGDFDSYSAYRLAFDSKVSSSKGKVYSGYGLLGAAAVAAGVGLFLYLTDEETAATAVWPSSPDGMGATAVVRW